MLSLFFHFFIKRDLFLNKIFVRHESINMHKENNINLNKIVKYHQYDIYIKG